MVIDLSTFYFNLTELNIVRAGVLVLLVGVFLWRKAVKAINRS